MPDPHDSRRAAPVSYRPPKGREAEFHARVAASGLSVNAFITARVFRRRRNSVNKTELARLLEHAAAIRDHLHEIAADEDDGAARPAVKAAARELAVLRAALLRAMERQP